TESARDLLRAAAVIGRRIPGALVQAVALQSEREAVAALEATCQARLLLEVETGKDTSYTFAHDLIREVVLADLSAARRWLLHRRVAEALALRSGERPLAQLAHHWVSAGEHEQAVTYLEQAGDHAQLLYAFVEAAGYYRECLAHLEALGRLLEREWAWARVCK